ncbi:hypothetical protein AN1V17_23780 [Vallitalea sediminicola]
MKSKKKNTSINILIGIGIVVLIILLIIQLNQNKEVSRGKSSGQVAFGIYNNNKILNSGSYIQEKTIKHKLEMSQNLAVPRDYLVLAFIDYVQTEFTVDDKIYNNYIIKLDKNDSKDIMINMNIPDNAKELCYVIIKKPAYIIGESDIKKACTLQEIMTLRYSLDKNDKNINIDSNIDIVLEGPMDNIFLSESDINLKALFTCNENEEKKLVLGNMSDKSIQYAVVQLLDWNQVTFDTKEMIKFFEVAPNTKISYAVDIPSVDKDSLIQYIAFPFPFNTSKDNFYSTIGVGTFRTTIIDIE